MTSPLQTLIASGTKLWLDTVDPEEVRKYRQLGATGATSNPVIISGIIKTGRLDDVMAEMIQQGQSDEEIAWNLADRLVTEAEQVFLPVWEATKGDDGYVSFELDPLIEDPERNLPHAERVELYLELGKRWSQGHPNRMIKVPNTDAGCDALEELVASGVTVNVTLTFTERQYVRARDAVWRGAQRRSSRDRFKSVYSIFVSRVDVYTKKHVPTLSPQAQGWVGIVNAKRIWRMNREFWRDKKLPLHQEIIFASTGVKLPEDPPWKYVEAFAGADIETNPPETNAAVESSGRSIVSHIEEMPPQEILDEIDAKVDIDHMERVLMEEGIKKFADPQKELLQLIAEKRQSLQVAR